MTKKQKIFLIVIFAFLAFIIMAKRTEFGYAKSEDKMWESYVLPDERNTAIGIIIFKGNKKRDAGNIYVETNIDGCEEKGEIEPQSTVFEVSTFMETLIIGNKEKKYYDYLEFAKREQPQVSLRVNWIDEAKQEQESKMEIEYMDLLSFLTRKVFS